MFSFCGLNNKMTTSENINLLWHISVNALPLCSSVSDFHLAVWVSALCISAIRKGTWRLSPSDRKTTVRAKTVAAICSSLQPQRSASDTLYPCLQLKCVWLVSHVRLDCYTSITSGSQKARWVKQPGSERTMPSIWQPQNQPAQQF